MSIVRGKNKKRLASGSRAIVFGEEKKSCKKIETKRDFVGRGGNKLAEAVSFFNFNFKDKYVLDIGSSTGGFTEVALRGGAKKVLAVEKGVKQMRAPLRFSEKIELREKTDVFSLSEAEGKVIEVVLADVSFVSLTKILKCDIIKGCDRGVDFLVMVKPQFEARMGELVNGVVKNETIRREIMKRFERWLKKEGFLVINKFDNKIKGRKGNKERFYWLRKTV